MLTARLYLHADGTTADWDCDFSFTQGSYQNILLNVFVPRAIMTGSVAILDGSVALSPFATGTAVSVFSKTILRNGNIAQSDPYYLRFVKYITAGGIEYGLFERLMPKSFLLFSGEMTLVTTVTDVVTQGFASATYDTSVSAGAAFTVSVDTSVLYGGIIPAVSAEYVFEFVDQWYLYSVNGTLVGETVDLADYGISLDASPVADDTITLTVSVPDSIVSTVLASQEITTHVLPAQTSPTPPDATIAEALSARVSVLEGKVYILNERTTAIESALIGKQNVMRNVGESDTSTVDGAINQLENDLAAITTYIETGEYPVGTLTGSLPVLTDQMLDDFVQLKESRAPRPGDVVLYYYESGGVTDIYKYLYTATGWTHYLIQDLQNASNSARGIVKGGTQTNISVNIVDGEILDILAPVTIGGSTTYVSIKTAAQKVAEYEAGTPVPRATADADGANIASTYMTIAQGASKQYVKDYALPVAFNDAKYITSAGFSDTIPDDDPPVPQFSVTPALSGYTELVNVEETIADMTFQLSSKNSYTTTLYIVTNADVSVEGLRVMSVATIGGVLYTLCYETTVPLTFFANTPVAVQLSHYFDSITGTITLADGDTFSQIVDVFNPDAVATFDVYCTPSMPSATRLSTAMKTIAVTSGLVGEIPYDTASHVYDSGNSIVRITLATYEPQNNCAVNVYLTGAALDLYTYLNDEIVVQANGVDYPLIAPSSANGSTACTAGEIYKHCRIGQDDAFRFIVIFKGAYAYLQVPNFNYAQSIDYDTTAPTADNTEGLKVKVLSSDPGTHYNGWIYLII